MKLYENVGKKICVLAKIIGIIGLLAMVVGLFWSFAYLFEGRTWMIGLPLGIFGGGIFMILSSWFSYGFGQLVDDVHNILFEDDE